MALTFLGGINLAEYRTTTGKPFSVAEAPEVMKYPLSGYIPDVKAGDSVCINSPLMHDGDGFCRYSSVSGTVKEITDSYIAVANDGKDSQTELFPKICKPVNELTREEILGYIKACGIVGTYSGEPLYKKLTRCFEKVNRLVISCVESDPCSGHVRTFAAAHPEEIVLGAKIIMLAMGIKKTVIAFGEKDGKIAAAFDKVSAKKDLVVSAFVDKKYPQGNDRILVTSIYNVEIPFSLTPDMCGYLVLSAETVYNVYDCLKNSCSVYEKALTVTGDGIKHPANVIARIGTPFEYLMKSYGADENSVTVSGGVLNGQVSPDGVLELNTNMLFAASTYGVKQQPCIRCSRCATICPMHLMPYRFYENNFSGFREKSIDIGLYNCIECGCCSYVCPSRIDLLGTIRREKKGITEIEDIESPREINCEPTVVSEVEAPAVNINNSDNIEQVSDITDDSLKPSPEAETRPEQSSEPQEHLTAVPDFNFTDSRKKSKKRKKSKPAANTSPIGNIDDNANGGENSNDSNK